MPQARRTDSNKVEHPPPLGAFRLENNIHPNYNSHEISFYFLTNDGLIFFFEICMQQSRQNFWTHQSLYQTKNSIITLFPHFPCLEQQTILFLIFSNYNIICLIYSRVLVQHEFNFLNSDIKDHLIIVYILQSFLRIQYLYDRYQSLARNESQKCTDENRKSMKQ